MNLTWDPQSTWVGYSNPCIAKLNPWISHETPTQLNPTRESHPSWVSNPMLWYVQLDIPWVRVLIKILSKFCRLRSMVGIWTLHRLFGRVWKCPWKLELFTSFFGLFLAWLLFVGCFCEIHCLVRLSVKLRFLKKMSPTKHELCLVVDCVCVCTVPCFTQHRVYVT